VENFNQQCLPNSDERTCKITGNNFSVVTAIELVVEKIIEGKIQESKGEFMGTPSSQIVPYDPSKDTGETKNEKVRTLGSFRDNSICWVKYIKMIRSRYQ